MLKFSFVCRFVKVLVVEVEVERVVVVDGAVEEEAVIEVYSTAL